MPNPRVLYLAANDHDLSVRDVILAENGFCEIVCHWKDALARLQVAPLPDILLVDLKLVESYQTSQLIKKDATLTKLVLIGLGPEQLEATDTKRARYCDFTFPLQKDFAELRLFLRELQAVPIPCSTPPGVSKPALPDTAPPQRSPQGLSALEVARSNLKEIVEAGGNVEVSFKPAVQALRTRKTDSSMPKPSSAKEKA